jgi:hypothetical protein
VAGRAATAGDAAALQRAVERLRSPATIRARAEWFLRRCEADGLEHFRLRPERLDAVAERVVAVTRAAHPTLAIPYHARWRHFVAGSPAAARRRLERLEASLQALEPQERARARFDLVITSVLLDAGAGPGWPWVEPGSGETYSRSEGLALASLEMFLRGAFSSDPQRPLQADAEGLRRVDDEAVAQAFQAREDNPLVGLEGRAALLRRLGDALHADRARFGDPARVGHLFDHLAGQAEGGRLPAAAILRAVLEGMGSIWPGRESLGGVNLGDVWFHPALAPAAEPGDDLVPFHKLSQWLVYSLLEPLEAAGVAVVGLDQLTGLPEYRNGGLLLDLGLLEPKHRGVLGEVHHVGSPVVVEWRALTVALLDRAAERVRGALGLSAEDFPLAKVLEGGTWQAGRLAARERRPDGVPPLQVQSDGTVF